jgi:thioredoxin 1
MDKGSQTSARNGLRRGDPQFARRVARVAERNRRERGLRETLVREFPGISQPRESQPEPLNACLQEAVRFPRRLISRTSANWQLNGRRKSERSKFRRLFQILRKNPITLHMNELHGIHQVGMEADEGMLRFENNANKRTNMNSILEINEPDFAREVLKSTQPVLVNFLADWSQPCQRLEPVLAEVAVACDGRAKVVKVNADANPELGMAYWIQSIPTLLYFIHGEMRAQIVGTASKEAILAKLESLIN